MKSNYEDIRKRIKEEPIWYDQNGAPRYADFHPELCPDIYAQEVVLLHILCQHCKLPFMVEIHASRFERFSIRELLARYAKDKKKTWTPLHYGDPPIHGCVGDTMNCEDSEILEYWTKDNHNWVRVKKYEIVIEDRSARKSGAPIISSDVRAGSASNRRTRSR